MADGRSTSIAKAAGLALIALGLPPATLGLIGPTAKSHPILTVLAIVAYEFVVAVGTFVSQVYSKLNKQWVDRASKVVDDWLRRAVSRYHRKYLAYLVESESHVELRGVATLGGFTLTLEEAYVNLRLDPKSTNQLQVNPIFHGVSPSSKASVWTWMQQAAATSTNLAIVGPPGSGKTTLLKHITVVLALGGAPARRHNAPAKLPVVVILRERKAVFSEKPPRLVEFLETHLAETVGQPPPNWVERHLSAGRFCLMFDGLDEIAEATVRRSFSAWVDEQRKRYPKNLFVVTSRPAGYEENPLAVATVVQVEPFDDEQIGEFVKQWYLATEFRSYGKQNQAAILAATSGANQLLEALSGNPRLKALAVNPLLLTMIANVHRYRGALPGSRVELYDEVCNVFLGARATARGQSIEMTVAQRRTALQHLAMHMMQRNTRSVPLAEAVRVLTDPLKKIGKRMEPTAFLKVIEDSSGLLLEMERDTYGFAHLTFQEYLAACQLATDPAPNFHPMVANIWWRECLRLYAAQADATSLILAGLDAASSDVKCISLVMNCLAEAREVREDVRVRLDSLSNVTDETRNSVSERRLAGAVHLIGRQESTAAEGDELYGGPITNIEYQAFLDDGHGDQVPYHWTECAYPPGMWSCPVYGLSSSASRAFRSWLPGILGDYWLLRLPRIWDIPSLIEPRRLMTDGLESIWVDQPLEVSCRHADLQFELSLDGLSDERVWPPKSRPRIGDSDLIAALMTTLSPQAVERTSQTIGLLEGDYSAALRGLPVDAGRAIEKYPNWSRLQAVWYSGGPIDGEATLSELATFSSLLKEHAKYISTITLRSDDAWKERHEDLERRLKTLLEQQRGFDLPVVLRGEGETNDDPGDPRQRARDLKRRVDESERRAQEVEGRSKQMSRTAINTVDALTTLVELSREWKPTDAVQPAPNLWEPILVLASSLLHQFYAAESLTSSESGLRVSIGSLEDPKTGLRAETVQRVEMDEVGNPVRLTSGLELALIQEAIVMKLRRLLHLSRRDRVGDLGGDVGRRRRVNVSARTEAKIAVRSTAIKTVGDPIDVLTRTVAELSYLLACRAAFHGQKVVEVPQALYIVRQQNENAGSLRIRHPDSGKQWHVPVRDGQGSATILANGKLIHVHCNHALDGSMIVELSTLETRA